MRLFLAIDPPDPLRAALAAHAAAYARSCPAARPVPAGQVHLTVHFLGDVAEDRTAELSSALAEAARRVPAFTLAPAGLALAPPRGAPRMLWATFRAEAGFLRLVDAAREACRPYAPAANDRQEALPHATLARFRGECAAPETLGPDGLQPFTVRECILYASELRPEGPRYTPLARFALSDRTA